MLHCWEQRDRREALGRSRGGYGTKACVIADGRGRDTALLDPVEQALPDPEMRPADEGLRRLPPGPELAGDTAPLGAVLVPPKDGLDRLPQVGVRHLAGRPDLVDQRLQLRPPRVCQNVNARVLRHPRQLRTSLRAKQSLRLVTP